VSAANPNERPQRVEVYLRLQELGRRRHPAAAAWPMDALSQRGRPSRCNDRDVSAIEGPSHEGVALGDWGWRARLLGLAAWYVWLR